jgi:hypothetical protein
MAAGRRWILDGRVRQFFDFNFSELDRRFAELLLDRNPAGRWTSCV